MKKGKGREQGDSKNVSPADRVRAYPDEQFSVSGNNKLFCLACREELATKKSSIESHTKSQKDISGKKKLAVKKEKELGIVEALQAYDTKAHPVGQSVPMSSRLYRVKVVTAMLRGPLSIIFDGTTHVCEAMVLVLRFMTDNWELSSVWRE